MSNDKITNNKPVDFPFMYEPSCEQEVVGLFCLIASQLGFKIINLGMAYPDCIAINKSGKKVRIELEHRSSEFITHKHDPKKCDYIACWVNDAGIKKPKVITLKPFFPFLKKNSLNKKSGINIHQVVIKRASEPDGLSYAELVKIYKNFHFRNAAGGSVRCLARLYKWGAFPFADNGRLRIRRSPKITNYAVQADKTLLKLAEDLLALLKEQSRRGCR